MLARIRKSSGGEGPGVHSYRAPRRDDHHRYPRSHRYPRLPRASARRPRTRLRRLTCRQSAKRSRPTTSTAPESRSHDGRSPAAATDRRPRRRRDRRGCDRQPGPRQGQREQRARRPRASPTAPHWCISLTNAQGDKAVAGYKYSAKGGLATGTWRRRGWREGSRPGTTHERPPRSEGPRPRRNGPLRPVKSRPAPTDALLSSSCTGQTGTPVVRRGRKARGTQAHRLRSAQLPRPARHQTGRGGPAEQLITSGPERTQRMLARMRKSMDEKDQGLHPDRAPRRHDHHWYPRRHRHPGVPQPAQEGPGLGPPRQTSRPSARRSRPTTSTAPVCRPSRLLAAVT